MHHLSSGKGYRYTNMWMRRSPVILQMQDSLLFLQPHEWKWSCAIWSCFVSSRVLRPALSVRWSVHPSVRPSIRPSVHMFVTFYFFGDYGFFGLTAPAQMIQWSPAHPHATGVAVYLASFSFTWWWSCSKWNLLLSLFSYSPNCVKQMKMVLCSMRLALKTQTQQRRNIQHAKVNHIDCGFLLNLEGMLHWYKYFLNNSPVYSLTFHLQLFMS